MAARPHADRPIINLQVYPHLCTMTYSLHVQTGIRVTRAPCCLVYQFQPGGFRYVHNTSSPLIISWDSPPSPPPLLPPSALPRFLQPRSPCHSQCVPFSLLTLRYTAFGGSPCRQPSGRRPQPDAKRGGPSSAEGLGRHHRH